MYKMKLINQKDDPISYSLDSYKFLHLEPKEFIFVPDTCRTLHIKPSVDIYSLSIDQLMGYPDIKNIIVVNQIKSGYAGNSLVVQEDDNWLLKFLHVDFSGIQQRIYAPKFDITKYDFNGKPEIIIIDKEKINNKLKKMTNPNSDGVWWFIILVFIIIVLIPICLSVVVSIN